MTLPDLYDDPPRMAAFMGWPFEALAIISSALKNELSPAWINYRQRLAAYRAGLLEEWLKSKHNPHKPKTWAQTLAEWIKAEFGFTKGTVKDRLELCRMSRKDIYQPA